MSLILGSRLYSVAIGRGRLGKATTAGKTYARPMSPSAEILTAVAGAAAEQIRFRRGYEIGGPDLRYARALVNKDGVSTFCLLASSLLRAHWGGVVGLAFALEERGKLTGPEAWDAFCRGLVPPQKRRRKVAP